MQAAHLQEPPSHRSDVTQKVLDHPGLERRGAAVVNTDSRAYKEALARRAALKEKEDRLVALERQVADMGGKMDEIKEMLKCLLPAAKSSSTTA